jgi:hypothetical protein
MKIYHYRYNEYKRQVTCTEIEVTETAKQYRATSKHAWHGVFRKQDAGKLMTFTYGDSAEIYFTDRNDDKAMQIILDHIQQSIQILQDNIKEKEENAKKIKSDGVAFDIVD